MKIEWRLEVLAGTLLFWPCCLWCHLKTEDLAVLAAKPDPRPAHRAIITLLEKYTAISKFRCWILFLPPTLCLGVILFHYGRRLTWGRRLANVDLFPHENGFFTTTKTEQI